MKIKVLAVAAIILVLACAMVAPASAQTRRRSPKRKPAAKTTPATTQAEPTETAEEIEGRRQLNELGKLSSEQTAKLKQAIDLLQFEIRKVKVGGFPKYFLSDDTMGESSKLEPLVNGCLDFLPDGLMRNALAGAFRALVDAWLLDHAANTGVVTSLVLDAIDRYRLEDASPYTLSREVLDIAAGRILVTVKMFELIPAQATKPQ